MKWRPALFVLLSLFVNADEGGSKIFGSWKSDGERTTRYLTEKVVLSDHQKIVLSELFGKSTLVFNPDGTGSMTMAPMRIPKKDGDFVLTEGSTTEFTYSIVGESESQVVIKVLSGAVLFEGHPFELYTFSDKNSFSVRFNVSMFEIPGHEFFSRIDTKPIKKRDDEK